MTSRQRQQLQNALHLIMDALSADEDLNAHGVIPLRPRQRPPAKPKGEFSDTDRARARQLLARAGIRGAR